MEPSTFLERFKELVHVLEQLGGQPGVTEARLEACLAESAKDKSNPPADEKKSARAFIQDEYLGIYLQKVEPLRFFIAQLAFNL